MLQPISIVCYQHSYTYTAQHDALQFPHPPSDPVEEEDDLLALGRDVPRQLDDPLLLVVLQIQGAAIDEKERMKKGGYGNCFLKGL